MPSTITKPCTFVVAHHTDYFIHFLGFRRENVRELLFIPFSSTFGSLVPHPLQQTGHTPASGFVERIREGGRERKGGIKIFLYD
jgi:hypothetical protein